MLSWDGFGADSTGPDVPRLEAEIDRLVYARYNLTEEIAVVERENDQGKNHQGLL